MIASAASGAQNWLWAGVRTSVGTPMPRMGSIGHGQVGLRCNTVASHQLQVFDSGLGHDLRRYPQHI